MNITKPQTKTILIGENGISYFTSSLMDDGIEIVKPIGADTSGKRRWAGA